MKIEEVEYTKTTYKITKYCCKKLKKELKHNNGYIGNGWNGEILIGNCERMQDKIDYCPYCGEKINTKSIIERNIT